MAMTTARTIATMAMMVVMGSPFARSFAPCERASRPATTAGRVPPSADGRTVQPVRGRGEAAISDTALRNFFARRMAGRTDGTNWAIVFNSEVDGSGKEFAGIADRLLHQIANQIR